MAATDPPSAPKLNAAWNTGINACPVARITVTAATFMDTSSTPEAPPRPKNTIAS